MGARALPHPHFYKWLGTVSGRTANKKLTFAVLTITKVLTKTTNCAFRAKKWRGTTQKQFSGAFRGIGTLPPLSLWTGAHTFKFVPAPLARGHFRGETCGNAIPIVKVFKTAKMHYIAGFCTYDLKIFSGVLSPDLRTRPSACTQTPISTWLASIPIVPALRNDHCQWPTINGNDIGADLAHGTGISMPWTSTERGMPDSK